MLFPGIAPGIPGIPPGMPPGIPPGIPPGPPIPPGGPPRMTGMDPNGLIWLAPPIIPPPGAGPPLGIIDPIRWFCCPMGGCIPGICPPGGLF
eukprot:CAMPEP_0170486120 /NCGR_PEP_ID=MMETSP0208-20121228/5208_1 /TAXON_ID=197538 /ORGANISM="Strombidium inclinatum, Strain S3" /LENGTH=91 /DNA_ID=CAMNT_0010759963 /DNA_START=2372 /DNA_END=2647 /DNA_ORIENTATION=-